MVALVEVQYHFGSHADTFWFAWEGTKWIPLGTWAEERGVKQRCVQTCNGTHPVYRYMIPDDLLPVHLKGRRNTSRGNTRVKKFTISKPGTYRINYVLEAEEWSESEVVEI